MGRLDDIEHNVNARMEEIARRLGGGVGGVSLVSSPTPELRAGLCAAPASQAIFAAVGTAAAVSPTCSPEMWETSPHELLQLMQYVCSSPHVTSNRRYAELVGSLNFDVQSRDATVNAYATVRDGKEPVIMLLGGAIRFANLISCAYVGALAAREKSATNPLPEITAALGKYCLECRASFSGQQACEFALRYNLHLVAADPTLGRKARSFAAGLLIGILAHEFGHLALGHCYGSRVNLEISRNQEREADSFASSVISSSPFGDYLVFGTILWEAVWVWVERATGQTATTHPLASERLADLIRANPSVAAEFGLS